VFFEESALDRGACSTLRAGKHGLQLFSRLNPLAITRFVPDQLSINPGLSHHLQKLFQKNRPGVELTQQIDACKQKIESPCYLYATRLPKQVLVETDDQMD
jgi:hypothetical protein